jgi:hypothetical protein
MSMFCAVALIVATPESAALAPTVSPPFAANAAIAEISTDASTAKVPEAASVPAALIEAAPTA